MTLEQNPRSDWHLLRLYVSGASAKSTQAVESVHRLCEEHFAGRYELQVIDIYQQPELGADHQIVAVPVLVVLQPGPLRKSLETCLIESG